MKNRISIAITVTGFSGIAAQLLLLRELLIVFAGNEFSIGIVLANWLVLEAFGCYFLGKKAENIKDKITAFAVITLLFALSLPAMVFLTRILRNILDISIGEGVGILPILYSSFFILLPVSLLHGALFTFGCKVYSTYSDNDAHTIGKAYIYETIGTMLGGLSWTYLLIPYFHVFQVAVGLALLNVLVCYYLLAGKTHYGLLFLWKNKKIVKSAVTIISLLLLIFGSYYLISGRVDELHDKSVELQWKGQNIVHYQNSIYGNIVVMEVEGQYTFFFDGIPHITTPIPDIMFVEEFVHLSLLSHPNPENLLILSGGAGGIINEILKHPTVENVDYTELDPLLMKLLREYPTRLIDNELNDERVNVIHTDGRLFLKMSEEKYDVIFVGLNEPSDLQTNRFFTKDFFSQVNEKLLDPGIIAIHLPGSLTYLNNELKDLNSSLYHTMKSIFPNVRVIPGDGTNIFLASNSRKLSLADMQRFMERFQERELQAEQMMPWHIEYKLNPGWISWFHDFIENASDKINRDFKPIALYYSISHWNALFNPALNNIFRWFERVELKHILIVFAVLAALIMVLRAKKVVSVRSGAVYCIGTTGFAGMMYDLVLIFAFQVIYGYVFAWIGLLVTFFMAGSAVGAFLMTAYLPRIKNNLHLFIKLELMIVIFTLILPLIFILLQPLLDRPAVLSSLRLIFLPLSFFSGFSVGVQFPLANKIYLHSESNLSKTAGLFYGSDLLGGWLGGILGSVFLLPVLGLLETCLFVVLLKLTSLLTIFLASKK